MEFPLILPLTLSIVLAAQTPPQTAYGTAFIQPGVTSGIYGTTGLIDSFNGNTIYADVWVDSSHGFTPGYLGVEIPDEPIEPGQQVYWCWKIQGIYGYYRCLAIGTVSYVNPMYGGGMMLVDYKVTVTWVGITMLRPKR